MPNQSLIFQTQDMSKKFSDDISLDYVIRSNRSFEVLNDSTALLIAVKRNIYVSDI